MKGSEQNGPILLATVHATHLAGSEWISQTLVATNNEDVNAVVRKIITKYTEKKIEN